MSTDLASLVVKLEAQTADYDAKLDQATRKLQGFHSSTNKALDEIKGAIVGLLAFDKLADLAKSVLENAANLDKLSQSSGISVEELSKLQFAAKQSGIESDAFAVGLKKLNVAMAEAGGSSTSKAATAFRALGISVTDANGRQKDAGTILAEVADKFAAYKDGANKTAIAVALFGKAGDQLIPVLNKGAAGLKEFGDQAERAGIVISAETAAAAEEFEQKLKLIQATAVGTATQLEAKLLPTLNDLADVFLTSSKDAADLNDNAEILQTGLKLLADTANTVVFFFKDVGKGLGALGAAAVAAAHLNFTEAGDIIAARLTDRDEEFKKANARSEAIWRAGQSAILEDVKIFGKKIKEDAPSIVSDELLKKLSDFRDQLRTQFETLDQGTVAATRYKLAHGDLKDALDKTGAAGQRLKGQILAAATALETAQLAKEVADVNAQLKEFAGDTVGAGVDKLNASTAQLAKRLKDVGDSAGLASLDKLKEATAAQLQFNKLQTDAARISSDLAIAEGKVNDALANGAITELQAQAQISDARVKAAAQLSDIATQEKAVADAAGNPVLVQSAKEFGAQVDSLKSKTKELENQVRGGLESAFANNFSDLITGAKSFGDSVRGLLKDIEKQFADLIAKNFAQQLFGAATGDSGGGSLGGIVGTIAGLFTGAHADGGTIPAGHWGTVGERGMELAYAGSRDLNIVPMSKDGGGGSTVIQQHFHIQAPNGSVSRQTQTQIGAAAARSLAMSNRRNN